MPVVSRRSLADLPGPVISIDTETTGLDVRHGALPYLVTICRDDGEQLVWEWDVDPYTRKPEILSADADEIRDIVLSAGTLLLQNAKFDVAMLAAARIVTAWPWARTHDLLIMSHLLGSNQPKDLTSVALRWLGVDVQPFEDRLKDACKKARDLCRRKYPDWRIAKDGLADMPSVGGGGDADKPWKADTWLPRTMREWGLAPEFPAWNSLAREYANSDSEITLLAGKVMLAEIERKGYGRLYAESRRLPEIVAEMEGHGIGYSRDRAAGLRTEFQTESKEFGFECKGIANDRGFELELPKNGINNSLQTFVFDILKLEHVRNPKAKTDAPALDKKHAIPHWLATLPHGGDERRFIETLLKKRARDTALTYLDAYDSFAVDDAAFPGFARLYPSMNITGTTTLRMSSENPNGQQIKKGGMADVEDDPRNLRTCFGPATNREWRVFDYENLELYIPAYDSGERAMIELFERPDDPPYFGSYHLLNASIIYPREFEPLAATKGAFKKKYPGLYTSIKGFGFAVQYGAMPESGTADRAAGVKGAQRMVQDRLKEHTKLNQKWVNFAIRNGYVETMPDRNVDPSQGYPLWLTRSEWGKVRPTEPLNYRVQGTAMWCTRRAMVRCHAFLRRINAGGRFAGKLWPGGYYLVLQVHDEMDFDFPALGKANAPIVAEIKRLMEMSGQDINVPLRVAASWHPNNWGEEITLSV